ncbi:hypothetical protein Tco_1336960 [Tanacetum coccineum]
MWEAIKSRFGGNDESKKMQKYILKQQFEGFFVSNSEGLHKGYDRFQSLLSQLEIHGAGVSTEMMQNQAKNSRVFESDVKGSTASSSSTQNVAFISENTSSTNDASGLQQFRAQTTEELFVSKEIKESNAKLKKLLLGLNRDRRLGLGYGWEGAEKEVGKDLEDGGREDVWGVWDLGIPKRHVLYVEVLAILLEIVIFMRKRMAKQAELNNRMSKGSGQREIRPISIRYARTSGTNTVNTARHNFNRRAVPINAARKVNTVKPIVNNARPKAGFHKSVSSFRKSFNRTTALRTNFSTKGTEVNIDAGDSKIEAESAQDYFVLPIWSSYTSTVKSSKAMNTGEEPNKHHDLKTDEKPIDKEDQVFLDEFERLKRQEKDANDAAEALRKEFSQDTEDLLLQAGAAKASSTNIVNTASTPTVILGDPKSAVQTRSKVTKSSEAHAFRLSESLLKIENYGIMQWQNNNDERGVVVRKKARLLAQGHRQEEGIDYDMIPKYPKKSIIVEKALYGFNTKLPKSLKGIKTHLTKPQPTPSPPHPSEAHVEPQSDPSPGPSPTIPIPDPIPEGSGGNLGSQSSSDKSLSGSEGGLTLQSVYDLYLSLCTQVTAQAAEIKSLKAQVKKLKKQARPFILHHKAWLRTVKRKNQNKKKVLKTSKRRSVFKQGRKTVKSSKGAPTVPTNTEWDDLDMDIDDTMDYTLAQDEGKTDKVDEKGESTAQQQSTDRQDEGTDMPKVSTARTKLSTDKVEEGTAEPEPRESTSSAAQTTPTPTPTTFGDDETIAQVLLNMSQAKAVSKEKEKGVEIRNAENAERPRTTSTRSVLTLKPLPKIDPNDKGKKRIEEDEESDTESEEITEAKKKFDQIAHDEEVARKMQEEWEAEEERKRLTEEEATKTALSNEYDFIQARIEADRLLAERVQEAEREQFTVEERAKFLHDTIATQRRILAQQRTEAIRNKPPTKNQFRNQMMTYLKHVGNKKHADLKTKSFDEIKALYEKVKRFDDSFITIGSTEDERKIKEMNEGASDPDKKKKFVKEDVSAKVPAKQDVVEQGTKKRKGGHMKMIARKRKRPQPDVDSDDEHRKCLKIVTFEGTIDSEIMERKSQDLFHLYDLVMKQYSESTPEGIELILWGDLKIMMESSIEVTDQGDFWNDQQDWEIVTWRLYEACGVCILEFKDGTVIHMLVERKYPLSKELLQRMLDFRLEVEVESTVALDLIRRIAKDVKETLRSDQDLSECLNTSSMKLKESTPKKHEVKQVQQSCLGEDCWELYIPDLVPNSMAGSEEDIPPPPPPLQTLTYQTPHTVSTIKLLILNKGEYDIWAMKMEHYLAHTDYPIWGVIQRGNGLVSVSTDINGSIKVLPPKTAKEILARERERKARTTLLMALPEDHLAKFHKMTDAKEI